MAKALLKTPRAKRPSKAKPGMLKPRGSATRVLKSRSLREQVYDLLRERITNGQLTFDDRLVDVDIAREMGVSRMPVREALMQLLHDGMIESTTRGFVLRRFNDQDIEEIFEIRRLLEPAGAASAAGKMTIAALHRMDVAINTCARASKAGDSTAFILANAAFRGAWLAQVANTQLASAITRFADHVQVVRLTTLPSKRVRDDVLARMRAIYDAFRRGDPRDAAELFEKHVEAALAAFHAERVP